MIPKLFGGNVWWWGLRILEAKFGVTGNRSILWAFLGQVTEKKKREVSVPGPQPPRLVEGTFCHIGMLHEEARK